MRVALVVFLVAGLLPAMAADQVGTVSSGGAITLRGNNVPGPVYSLPLTSGDEIVTNATAANISLDDRSSVTAEANSRLWTERQGVRTVVCLAQGALHFNVAAGSRVRVCALGRPIDLQTLSEGSVSIESADRIHAAASRGSVRVDERGSCGCAAMPAAQAKGWSGPKKAAVTLGTAGGAAAGIVGGLVASGAIGEEPAPVSPSSP